MTTYLRSVCCLAVMGMLAGCGKSDSSSKPADAAAAATPPAPTAAVESGGDLVGTWWVTDDKAPLMGLEFGKDNKAVVTEDLLSKVTADYAVMENGRLRLAFPNGQTEIFKCNVDSQALTLAPESAGEFPTLHLKKLDGQTIAEAQRAKQQAMQKKRDDMLAAIRGKVGQSNLVLESADPSMHLMRFALDVKGGPDQWQGTATAESNPPLLRHAIVSIVPSDPPKLQVQLDQVQGPPGEGDRQPTAIMLIAAGEPAAVELQDHGLALRSDGDAYKAVTDAYQKVVQDRQTAIDQFAAAFGAFCRLQGDFRPANAPATATPTHADFGLLRVEGKPAFMVANMAKNDNPAPADFNGAAVIQFIDGKPAIVLQNYGGTFTAVDGNAAQLQGTIQNLPGTLAINNVMSKDQLIAQRKQVDDFVKTTMGQGVQLVGTIDIDNKPDKPVPVSMNLKTDANLNLTGTIDVPHLGEAQFDTPGKVVETLFGALVQFEGHQKIKPGMSSLVGGYRKGTLSLTFDGATPKIAGVINGGYQSGPAVLAVASDDVLKSQHDKITKVLTDGADFVLADPRPRNNTPVHLNLKLDADGKSITGSSTPGLHDGFFTGGSAVHGTLSDDDGFPLIDLTQDPGAGPQNRKIAGGELKFWVLFDDAGKPVLSGYWNSATRNPKAAEPAKAFLVVK